MASCEINETGRLIEWSTDDGLTNIITNPEEIYKQGDCGIGDFVLHNDGTVEFSPLPEIAAERRAAELKAALADTDYYAGQCIEDLIAAIGDVEPLDLFVALKILKAIVRWNIQTKKKFGAMLAKRKEWRDELNELVK